MRYPSVLLLLAAGTLAAQTSRTPTMGWSSWNTFGVNISEALIKGQADAMVSQGLAEVGYDHINIDDGFQYGRLANGKVRS
ncbi:MAG: alpha-galactosidase, partial [Bacteroidaceae bacterium]|nr:alpha-galactosidase [Bacteroidaceae bacterium]